MNIFVLDLDPFLAAHYANDRHCVKMILESCQLLSTAHHLLGDSSKITYKATHANHPCAIWVRRSSANYEWLVKHTMGLLDEYTLRYGKIHKCDSILTPQLLDAPNRIPHGDLTPFALAMPDQYKVYDDPVTSYRNYYIGEKLSFSTWKHGITPSWISKS